MAVDPIVSGAPAASVAAMIAEELASLAADAGALHGRLTIGDVVPAVVLPSNGLTDLLAIGGLRVAAELPPTLVPGQTIMVEVTGFTGDRINLAILPNASPPDPLAPNPGPPRTLPPAAVPAAPAIASRAPGPPAHPGVAPATEPGPLRTPRAPTAVSHLGNIEARIATARAAVAPPSAPSNGGATAPPRRGAIGGAPLNQAFLVRAAIAPRPPSIAAAPAAAVAHDPAPRRPDAFTDPATLLRALRLAVTPSNLAMARLALTAPQRLPAVLAMLERALPDSADPHVATLRTLTAFLARIAPTSPVLAAQVAAFVDHVVVGRDGKLAQLLAARSSAGGAAADDAAAPRTAFAAERAALRAAALDYDLTANAIAVASDDDAPPSTALGVALDAALAAITGLQVNAAVALAAQPDGIAFSLPLTLPDGPAAAHLRIDRDAPGSPRIPLDGDNFHIGFVLETRRLGTVAIDLRTVGRSVTLAVKTEADPARRAFAGALATLTRRLETLRYRVVTAETVVAPRGLVAAEPATAASRAPLRDTRRVDLDA